MDDIFDLLITPFNDIVAKGQIAVENAGDDGPMLKAAQSLVTEGERALNKIEPLYRMLLDKHGSKFQDFLKENDAISNLHSELNDLLWEFDDYMELDDFEPEKFAELESVSRSAAPKIYDILTGMKLEVLTDHDTGMKLEVPTDHDTGMKLEVPTDHDYRLSLLPTLSLPHTRSLLKSPTESVETNQSSVFDHSRTDGINTPFPDHHGSSISTADSNPILSTAELNPLLIKVPSIKNYQGAVKPEKPIRVPEVDYFPIPVETEVQTPQHPPNPPNPFAVDCKLGPQSSFYVHKGFCDGVKEIINGGPGVRKTVKAGFASRTVIAKCITCHFELDFKALDLDINKSEHGNFIKNGIGYRLRFLQKSHLPTRRSDDIMYGCIFCVHQGQTLHASDATVFVSQKALFAHLARHPRPLPAVPGFTLIEQDEIPNRYKNNYDLHFKSPVETHPVLEKSDDICRMPAGISKEAARRMYGQQLLYDRTPALELVQGARIVGLSWPAKYLGEWCFGWHDGVYASLPMNILRLDPPPSSDIKTDGTSLVMATARWNFNIRDKFNHNWLKFEKDEVITNITWPYQEFWCWSGTNAKGKSGIFPQAFIDISTLKEFGGPGYDQADRASVLNNERRRNKSFSVPLRFSFRKKSRADIPASIPRSASSRELPPLLTPIPGAYTRDDPSAWDKTQAEALLPILDQQKTKDYKIEASPATNNLDHDQSLGEATNMESINEELLLDMKLEEVHQFGKCWTCSPIDSISTDKVPITISDVPVVIPVESRYPLRAPVTPPPDPHPKFIDPTRQITDNVISEIFRVYEDALGFYLLINGQLQIIIPDDFDYQYALSHRPREFGGLEVSYIMESMTPTAGITSQASAQVPQISTNASIPAQLAPGVNSTAGQSPTAHIDAMLKLTIGSAIQASVKGTKLKDRFEGRVGLMTRMGDRTFVTIPTHVVTSALTAAKSASFPGDSWINDVQIVSSNGNKELGPISETFDPAAGHFPLGFIHDVSLVDVSNAPVELVSNIKTPVPTEWLSNSGWQEIRYRTTRLHLLKHVSIVPSRQANIKSIGLLECQCQAVGQGIFRMRQPPRTTRFSLRRPSTGLDVRQDSEVWTGLVARSLLFRIHPDFRPDGAQSGTALCTMEELEDGTRCAKVAGFTAFAQDVSVVQNFDLEGPRLYSRLEQGRVAFYGAFQVPEVLREKHHIM